MSAPTGMDRREERDDYRRILIHVEHAVDSIEKHGANTPAKIDAVVQLFRSQLRMQRLMLDELDRQDTTSPEPEETIDFDTDLRIMLDAAEGNTTTEGENP